jgi:hypothetical protein
MLIEPRLRAKRAGDAEPVGLYSKRLLIAGYDQFKEHFRNDREPHFFEKNGIEVEVQCLTSGDCSAQVARHNAISFFTFSGNRSGTLNVCHHTTSFLNHGRDPVAKLVVIGSFV